MSDKPVLLSEADAYGYFRVLALFLIDATALMADLFKATPSRRLICSPFCV